MEVDQMDEQWLQNKKVEFDLTMNFPYCCLAFIVHRDVMHTPGEEKVSDDGLIMFQTVDTAI